MVTKNIAWNSGEGNITVTYNGKNDGSITITTDNNLLHSDRSLVIGVLTTNGLISHDITVMQVAKPYIDLSTAVVTAATLTYNGGALTPTVTVMLDGDEVPSTQYDVEYSNNTNAGTATITVTGKIDYTGTATGTFIINKANPVYTAPTATSPIYNGTDLNLLNAGSTAHGTILYSSNGTSWGIGIPKGTNASDYTSYWRLIGDSNHNSVSSASITTTISKVTPTVVAPTPNTLTYNGSSQALVTAGSTDWGTLKYSLNNSTWSTSVPTAVNYGTYTVYYKVDGDSNINSITSTSVLASIAEKRVTTPTITLDVSSYTYNGNQCTPTPTVKDGSTVIPPSEYTVSYSNNINAGTATVTISDNVGGNYYIIGSTTFTINKVTPTVTAPTAKTLTYTGNSQVLANAGSTNWGTLQYSADNSTWSTTIPSGTNAGTSYKVYYRVVGDSNINDVASTYITCAIGKAAPTYTAPTAKTLTYNGSALGLLNAGSTSHGTILYSSNGSTWKTSIPTGTNATSYNTYWRLIGDTNHSDIGSTKITVSISKVTPSITAPTAKSLTYNGSALALVNAGSVNFGTLLYSLDDYTWGTSVPTGTTATSYTVYYKVVGDSNVNDVPSQSVACSIGKASLSASVSMDGWTYGGTASNPSVSGNSGGGSITYNYKVNGAADSTYTATKPSNAGTYVVRAQIAETTNYYGATVTNTFTIAQATGSATVTGVTTTYNRGAQNLLTVSGNTGTMHYRVGTSGSWTTTIPSATNAGSTTIYFYMDASTNYTARGSASSPWSYVTGTINKATPVLSTSPTKTSNWTYDGASHALASGGAMKHSSSDSTAVAGTFSYGSATNAGSYKATWSFAPTDSTNYNSTSGNVGTVTVAKANAHTAPVANSTTYTGSAIALLKNGSANNKGTLEYSTNNSSWSTTVPTLTTAGTYTTYWRFTPTDTTNYNTISSTSISTTIGKAAGSISYATTSVSKTYGNSAFTNTLTKSGDGSVTYASSDTSVATVNSSGKVTIVKAGSCTITATVSDGTNYTYATKTASYSLSVAKANPTYTVPTAKTGLVYSGSAQELLNAGSTSHGTILYNDLYDTDAWNTSIPTATNAYNNYIVRWKLVGDANHNDVDIQALSVTIAKANSPITTEPVAKTGLVYNGTAQQLCTNGVASIAGTWNYPTAINAATTVQGTVYFTPTDSTNYNQYSKLISTSIAKESRTLSFTDSYVVLNTSSNTTKTATPSAGNGDGAITYSISSTTYATINSSSGKVTSKTSDGSATVTATIAEGTNYLSASTSYTLYVFATVHNYNFTGSPGITTLPPGTYQFQCWGAQGGSNAAASSYGITAQAGGKGGYSIGQLTVSQATGVRVYVGGQGSSSAGGYNGGGSTTGTSQSSSSDEFGYSKMGGGGGATDIRLSDGSYNSRMIVAGGGSGGAMCYREKTTSTTSWITLIDANCAGSDKTTEWGNIFMNPSASPTASQIAINTSWLENNGVVNGSVLRITISSAPNSYSVARTLRKDWGYYENEVRFTNTQTEYNYVSPSDINNFWLYIAMRNTGSLWTGTVTIELQQTSQSTTTSTESQVGYVGGGTSGGGYSNTYKGRQNAAGSDGSFYDGASQYAENWRYCSGAGGGGWYGGGRAYSDDNMNACKMSGGGSGWVNTYANRSYRPSGYTGLLLDSGTTYAGTSSFVAPGGGNEKGHAGNGYARITRL